MENDALGQESADPIQRGLCVRTQVVGRWQEVTNHRADQRQRRQEIPRAVPLIEARNQNRGGWINTHKCREGQTMCSGANKQDFAADPFITPGFPHGPELTLDSSDEDEPLSPSLCPTSLPPPEY